jgi:hypothetical protein
LKNIHKEEEIDNVYISGRQRSYYGFKYSFSLIIPVWKKFIKIWIFLKFKLVIFHKELAENMGDFLCGQSEVFHKKSTTSS